MVLNSFFITVINFVWKLLYLENHNEGKLEFFQSSFLSKYDKNFLIVTNTGKEL